MQLRDYKPGLHLRNRWVFFGGEIDSMVLSEGTDLKLMNVSEILTLNRFAPCVFSVVLLRSREQVIYRT